MLPTLNIPILAPIYNVLNNYNCKRTILTFCIRAFCQICVISRMKRKIKFTSCVWIHFWKFSHAALKISFIYYNKKNVHSESKYERINLNCFFLKIYIINIMRFFIVVYIIFFAQNKSETNPFHYLLAQIKKYDATK